MTTQDAPTSRQETIWPPSPTLSPEPPPRLTWWQNLFLVPEGDATTAQVLSWWEVRRWTYNKIVFGLGIPSFVLYLLFVSASAKPSPGEDVVEPLSLLIAPVAVSIAVNLCYTFGWIGELIWRAVSRNRTRRTGRRLMQLGIAFSLFVILCPLACWGAAWVWHIITGRKVDAL